MNGSRKAGHQHVAPSQASSARPHSTGTWRNARGHCVRTFEQEELRFSTAAGKLRGNGWARLAWSTNFKFAKKPCDARKKTVWPSVQHFGLRTIATSSAWNIGITFLTVANARSGMDKQTKNTALEKQGHLVGKTASELEEQSIEITSQAVGHHK